MLADEMNGDLATVIDTFGTGSYQVWRTASGPITNGNYASGSFSYFAVAGSMRPDNGAEFQNMPDSTYGLEIRKLYQHDAALWTVRPGYEADKVLVGTLSASIDLGEHTAHADGVLSTIAFGAPTDVVTLQLEAGSVAEAGVLDESAYPAIVYTFLDGVTTELDLETAITETSRYLQVATAGTPTNVLHASGDVLAATNLTGGDGEWWRVIKAKALSTFWKAWIDRLPKP
jgi:hypothetical protein